MALALGKTAGELEATMSAREFQDWRTFEISHPLPDVMEDLHTALLCVVASNIMRSADSTPAKLSDYMIMGTDGRVQQNENLKRSDDKAPSANEAEAFRRTLRGY